MDMPAGITFALSIAGGGLTYKALDGGIPHIGKGEVVRKGGSGSAFARNNLESVLVKEGLTLDEFNALPLTDVSELSTEQIAKLKNIRDAVPKIDNSTVIQKTIPLEDIENTLERMGIILLEGI